MMKKLRIYSLPMLNLKKNVTTLKTALDVIPKGRNENLQKKFEAFENVYGRIEDKTFKNRRRYFEQEIKNNPQNYNSWFKFIRFGKGEGRNYKIKGVYERAIANVQEIDDKVYWKEFFSLWISYALFQEFHVKSISQTRDYVGG